MNLLLFDCYQIGMAQFMIFRSSHRVFFRKISFDRKWHRRNRRRRRRWRRWRRLCDVTRKFRENIRTSFSHSPVSRFRVDTMPTPTPKKHFLFDIVASVTAGKLEKSRKMISLYFWLNDSCFAFASDLRTTLTWTEAILWADFSWFWIFLFYYNNHCHNSHWPQRSKPI